MVLAVLLIAIGAYLFYNRSTAMLAVRTLRRDMVRTSLTVLGILIGVASVVTVSAIGAGARDSIGQQIESMGSNMIIVFPQSTNASGARGMQGQGQRLTESDGQALLHEANTIKAVAPSLRSRVQVIAGERNASTSAVGTTTSFFDVRSWRVRRGEMWTPLDEQTKQKVVIVGSTVERKLFGTGHGVGQKVRIGRYNFRVAGVLESKGEAPIGGDQDDIVLMPISTMRTRIMKTAPDFAGVLMASATSPEASERAIEQVRAILMQRHHIQDVKLADFTIRSQKEFQQMQASIYGLLTVLLVLVAAISLVVGGIGVMNIMLVSVTERTREIGLRMAVGAQSADVRNQFLVEAIVVTLIGGIAGVSAGAGIVALFTKLFEWPMSIDPTSVAVSLITSGATGVVFGFFPAWRASHLDPIVALRHE